MSFTAAIIEMTKKIKFNKQYYKYDIKEMDNVLSDYLFKEQLFYRECEDEEYMSCKTFWKNFGLFFKLNSQLLFRLIFCTKVRRLFLIFFRLPMSGTLVRRGGSFRGKSGCCC